ncbi:flavodoxin family protein [Neobacillus sp. D3-1R]|uniref:flavodoxin family protein n=1 Tax=Neobacillus sp. D3-1R TaxID=3445778 RepID=UPI003F9FEA7D
MFVIYGSSRPGGNTEQLANIIFQGVTKEEVYLRDLNIIPITDKRHDPEGFQKVGDDYHQVAKQMLDHEEIIFVTPLYWYGMSGHMKNFIDRWSQSLRDNDLNFAERMKDKKMYVVIVGGKGARIKGLPLIGQFNYIFEFMKATFEGYLIGEASIPGDIHKDEWAIQQANLLNQKLKVLN